MILASAIGNIINPFAQLFGWVLAGYFSFTHNYGLAIILLTLTVMVVVFPLTRRGTRSMMRMQLLQPELLKIRNRYKASPGQSAEDKQANRTKLNEEMMALYRENNVSPTGGCLPMFLQFPIFIILYDVIRGMTKTATVGTGKAAHVVATPQYIAKKTALYHSLVQAHGVLNAFGLNLADSVRSHQSSWVHVVPYVIVILIAVALQYVSIWQITNRNPAASQANAQMQAAQKFMPLIFVFFYIVLPAGVGVYFIVSSAFRIGQQEWMYKRDPMITETLEKLKHQRVIATTAKAATPAPKGLRAKLRAAAEGMGAGTTPALEAGAQPRSGGKSGAAQTTGKPVSGKPAASSGRAPGVRAGSARAGSARRSPAKATGSGGGARPASQRRPGSPATGSNGSAAAGVAGAGGPAGVTGAGGPGAGHPTPDRSVGDGKSETGRPGGNRSQAKRPRRPR